MLKLQRLICRIVLIFPLFSLSLLLAGCESMNSKFDCPMGSGVMCRSISDVNAMVDGGKISTAYSKNNNNSYMPSKNSQTVTPPTSAAINHGVYGEPAKQSDSVLRVWVAPYQDQDGNYNQQSLVYATVKKGQWMVSDTHKQEVGINDLRNTINTKLVN